MFQYDPKMAENCWPVDVEYDATLLQALDKVAKSSGNDMLEIKVRVYHDDGRQQIISDYITSASLFKLKQIAKAVGREEAFNSGTFDAKDHENADLRVQLAIEQSDEYGDKNKIKKYLAPAAAQKPAPAAAPYPRSRETVMSGQPRSRQPLPPTPAGEPPMTEDDIPFTSPTA